MTKTICLSIFFIFTVATTGYSQAANYPNGSSVVNFEITDTEGNVYTLNEMVASDRYVLIEFLSSGCTVCHDPSAIFNEMYDKYGCNAGDVFMITVSGNSVDDTADIEEYDELYGGLYHHSPIVPGIDGDNTSGDDLATEFGVTATPTFCLISPDKIMVRNDIWPVYSISDFLIHFYLGEAPAEMVCSVGLEEEPKTVKEVLVYPNPAQSELTVQYNTQNSGTVNIEVLNMLGEVIISENFDETAGQYTHDLDVSTIQKGQYIVRITTANETTTSQFQKL